MLFNVPEITINIPPSSEPDVVSVTYENLSVPGIQGTESQPALKAGYSRATGHSEGILINTGSTDVFILFVDSGSPAPTNTVTFSQGIRVPGNGSFLSIPKRSNLDIYLTALGASGSTVAVQGHYFSRA